VAVDARVVSWLVPYTSKAHELLSSERRGTLTTHTLEHRRALSRNCILKITLWRSCGDACTDCGSRDWRTAPAQTDVECVLLRDDTMNYSQILDNQTEADATRLWVVNDHCGLVRGEDANDFT